MKPELFIRADGSPQIGLGHLVRCSALASMLKDDFAVTFFCKDIPDNMVTELEENGFECIRIVDENEFHLKITSNSIVVLDDYHFDTAYQKQIKSRRAKLVCIDDLHDKEFVADLIINHAPGITPQHYQAQPYTQFALGLDYALLRPAFLEQAKKQRTIEKIETVMICFGGSDSKNLTQSTLQSVMDFLQFKKIIVVTGSVYRTTDGFKLLVASDKRIDHRQALNEQQMIETMLEAELAIVPTSGIMFEVFSVGMPAISGYYIDNQIIASNSFKKMGLIFYCGNMIVDYQKKMNTIIKSISILEGNQMVQVQKSILRQSKHALLTLFKDLLCE